MTFPLYQITKSHSGDLDLMTLSLRQMGRTIDTLNPVQQIVESQSRTGICFTPFLDRLSSNNTTNSLGHVFSTLHHRPCIYRRVFTITIIKPFTITYSPPPSTSITMLYWQDGGISIPFSQGSRTYK